jgi:hypothetical protein
MVPCPFDLYLTTNLIVVYWLVTKCYLHIEMLLASIYNFGDENFELIFVSSLLILHNPSYGDP